MRQIIPEEVNRAFDIIIPYAVYNRDTKCYEMKEGTPKEIVELFEMAKRKMREGREDY